MMQIRNYVALTGLVAALVATSVLTAQEPQPKVEIAVVKYPELGALVKQLKGKVIVVDFWGDT
jgi:hypothetical protein